MTLPFSREEFFGVFARYNESIWPAPLFVYVIAAAAIVFALRGSRDSSRGVYGILAILWMWMGAVYHAAFFIRINPLAGLFAVVFVAQAFIFGGLGAREKVHGIAPRNDFSGWAGGALVFFGVVGYPLLSVFEGHLYPSQPTFGAPCPTTIFTLGLLIWAWDDIPGFALVIPVLWAIVGTLAAFQLGVREDLSLAGALVVVGLSIFMRKGIPANTARSIRNLPASQIEDRVQLRDARIR
jgi:uncharacterized protein DUF6064